VSELAIAGVPALLIPFPFAVDDHQTANARYLEAAGAAWIIQQRDLKKENLIDLIDGSVSRQTLADMAVKARSVAKPEASERVANICLEIMK
jgi:UDP-N-acetylglucosamine--N-acetylmuramyl-(pentapeptide) pyrophosphoryl-undecaprenol N-acetylglucosamine transferase